MTKMTKEREEEEEGLIGVDMYLIVYKKRIYCVYV